MLKLDGLTYMTAHLDHFIMGSFAELNVFVFILTIISIQSKFLFRLPFVIQCPIKAFY
jgi:hypothetical protein